MTRMLASVRSGHEAQIALHAGADVIDLKDPASGALGALRSTTARQIVRQVHGARLISATVGDVEMSPRQVCSAVRAQAALGIDVVKLGIRPSPHSAGCIAALAPLCRGGTRVVLVLFADLGFDPEWIARAARSGCAGAMLDTADKGGAPLPERMSCDELRGFVARCREHGLRSGLAGSLRARHVPALLSLSPDYLGFRGALCERSRTSGLAAARVRQIRALIPAHAGGGDAFADFGLERLKVS